jgi:hypothetical protein
MSTATRERVAARIAAHGLDGVDLPSWKPADGDDWARTLAEIARLRLGGFAVACVDDGVLTLDEQQYRALLDVHEEQLALDLRLDRLLRTCASLLARHAVPYRALKGPANARLVYERPELRSYADVDILVRGDRFDDTIALLREELFVTRRFDEPRPGFAQRFGKGVCLVAGDALEVDLHRTLAAGPYGATVDVAALFDTPPAVVAIGGTDVLALDRELAFVHACLHAVLGGGDRALVPLRDAAALAQCGLDVERVRSFGRRSRVLPVVALAIERLQAAFGCRVDPALTEALTPAGLSAFDRWALSTYAPSGPSYAAQAAATFWVLPTLRGRLAYARALVWPDDRYLSVRDGGHLRRLTRSAGLGLRWRPK